MGESLCLLAVSLAAVDGSTFHEGWESAPLGSYIPADATLISADEGHWFVGDTVSEFPECGPTPQRAEIIMHNGSRALRLTSATSDGGCADNVWVGIQDFGGVYNRGFSVALTPDTMIAFDESGQLDAPGLHGWGRNCLTPPCFDNISLLLVDSRGNVLAYVLQRYPDATPNKPNSLYEDTYGEIFLDPEAGRYARNLYDDFLTIPAFVPENATIIAVQFKVDELGSAILDNLSLGDLPLPRFTVTGTVRRSREDGFGIAGAEVVLQGNSEQYTAATDRHGEFQIPNVTQGPYSLGVTKAHYIFPKEPLALEVSADREVSPIIGFTEACVKGMGWDGIEMKFRDKVTRADAGRTFPVHSAPFEAATGERIEVWWVSDHYEARYYPNEARYYPEGEQEYALVGLCAFEDGLNSLFIYYFKDGTGRGVEALASSEWFNGDYGPDDCEDGQFDARLYSANYCDQTLRFFSGQLDYPGGEESIWCDGLESASCKAAKEFMFGLRHDQPKLDGLVLGGADLANLMVLSILQGCGEPPPRETSGRMASTPGDLNFDGRLDAEDLALAAAALGHAAVESGYRTAADVNGDYVVTLEDLRSLLLTSDLDGDRFLDWQEIGAGTDPLGSTSLLAVSAGRTPGDTLRLRWASVVGRRYSVQLSTTPEFMDAIELTGGIDGTGQELSFEHALTSASGHVFYRILVTN